MNRLLWASKTPGLAFGGEVFNVFFGLFIGLFVVLFLKSCFLPLNVLGVWFFLVFAWVFGAFENTKSLATGKGPGE